MTGPVLIAVGVLICAVAVVRRLWRVFVAAWHEELAIDRAREDA
jgi:hypothetical protein